MKTNTGETLQLLGATEVDVQYQSQQAKLPLLVVQGTGPNLLGRDWLQSIRLNWAEINCIRHASVDDVLQKHSEVFQEKLGRLKGVKAKIYVPNDATPCYFRPRTISYFSREKVDQELQRLQAEGIIEPVQFTNWAAPIVPILKSDSHNVRICGDYKVTINKVAKLDGYPLPRIDDIFSRLSGVTVFSKLDLTSAYQHIELDKETRKYTMINTPKGPFGISSASSSASASAIFQPIMENLLVNVPNVSVYLDDILVTGKDFQDHLHTLDRVLHLLEAAGLTLKKEKCLFAQLKVE